METKAEADIATGKGGEKLKEVTESHVSKTVKLKKYNALKVDLISRCVYTTPYES